MSLPAIALFTYNRPKKTREVLESLKKQGAQRIYIYCDGPKENDLDRQLVQQNLEIVNTFPLPEKKNYQQWQ